MEKKISRFRYDIFVEQDKNKMRLLNLQKKFSNGEIKEADISEEDAYLLRELYEEQIAELKENIEKYKKQIFAIWKRKKKGNI